MKLSPHFAQHELECPCCGLCRVDSRLLDLLEAIRERVDRPMILNSGVRCLAHNSSIGGSPHSAHMPWLFGADGWVIDHRLGQGMAADIRCSNSGQRWDLLAAALALGCRRIGVVGYRSWVHVDVAPHHPQPVMW